MRDLTWIVVLVLVGVAVAGLASAGESRARTNYLIYCMGCHGETGEGFGEQVPSMRGTIARLATLPDGRSYLLRVPGVTQSGLDAEQTAEVLNWTLREFSDAELASRIAPFTPEEVARARSRPLLEVVSARASLLRGDGLATHHPSAGLRGPDNSGD
jgi:cytochrome c553